MKALVVCLGNICRSPIGEGLLRHHGMIQGLKLKVDSAGTSGLHAGEAPDRRSVEVMLRHGLDIRTQRSAQVQLKDFEQYDVILAMDAANLRDLQALAERVRARGGTPCEVCLFDPTSDVPDPYYGGNEGFEAVYQQVDKAAAHWIESWKRQPL